MEALGLPASFGKPSASPSLPSKPENTAESSSRGGPSGRGPRGVVGGGKRGRGRGRGGHQTRSEGQTEESGQHAALNEGVKRPHPSSANHGRLSDTGWGGRQEAIARGVPRGGLGSGGGEGRGRGSSRGRGDFGRHDGPREPRPKAEGDVVTGFYMDSFVEDPWKGILEARQREARGA